MAHSRAFAAVLRQHRLAAGYSQEALAEKAGLSRRGISDIERGLKQTPHRDTVERLANALALDSAHRAAFLAASRGRRTEASQPSAPRPLLPLVGRHDELAALDACLSGSAPPTLFFAGEPGIGKSRLLAEAAQSARAQGWQVIAGGCTRRSGQEPYAPFADLLSRFLAARSTAQQRQDLQGCAWLARLLPELVELRVMPAPSWTLPPEQERRLLFAAISLFLANIAGPAGTLLALDDMQWAGADALDLLVALVRTESQRPLRAMGAYRSTEVRAGALLADTLADLARDGLVERVMLPPLTPAEAKALLASQVDASGTNWNQERIEQAVQLTDGVPFYLVCCAQSQPSERLITWSLAASLRQRVAQLPEVAQQLLRLAAVAGREVEAALLHHVAAHWGWQKAESIAALEAAVQAGLLMERDDAKRCSFVHDLIREVVLSDLSGNRRADLHLQMAEAVNLLPEPARQQRIAELAWHLVQAVAGARALPYVLQAGGQAEAVYAHAEAERHYRTAVEVAREIGDEAREAEALEKLAKVLLRLARYHEALATVEAALLAYRTLGDVEGEGRVAEGIELAHYALTTAETGIARLGPLLDDLRGRGLSQIGQARLYAALANLLVQSGTYRNIGEEVGSRLSEAVGAAERAMTLAREARHDGLLARVMWVRSRALVKLGRYEETLDAVEGLLPLAEAAGDLRTLCLGLPIAQALCQMRGDFELSQQHIDRALALTDYVADPFEAAFIWVNQAELAYYRGDWALAHSAVERSLEIVRSYELGAREMGMAPQCFLSLLYLVAGEQEQADALGAAPLAIAKERHDLQLLRWAYGLIAERDLLAGCAKAASAYLEPMLERPGLEEPQVLHVLPQYAWALLELGDEIEAEARALQSCQQARASRFQMWLVDGLRILAMVRLRQARWEDARGLLEESVQLCRDMPYPYAEAKALYVYGQLLATKGEPGRASKKYKAALSICARLGEGLYRPHIERALAGLKDDGNPTTSK